MSVIDWQNIIKLPLAALPKLEDLSGDLRLLAEIVGVEKAMTVAQITNGTPLRIYGGRVWVRRLRDKCMRLEYDDGGITVVDLARKYGVGERQAYNILGQAEVDDRQFKFSW